MLAHVLVRHNGLVLQPLMIALGMVMLDEVIDGPAQHSLAGENQPVDTLLFDRLNEPLRIGVQVGTLGG
jgi:hypothetical protein